MTHYEILSLPQPQPSLDGNASPTKLTPEAVKQAYRAALLQHHPDKSKTASSASIDAIKLAFTILSDPVSKIEYDRTLLVQPKQSQKAFHTGEEVLDLDDLPYDEEGGVWYRACRCGAERGYILREHELEEEESRGGREVIVGCAGCSLSLRVSFGVMHDEEGADESGVSNSAAHEAVATTGNNKGRHV